MSNNPSFSTLISQELSVLKEKYLFAVDETLQDPVFEGVVRNFNRFNECLIDALSRINRLTDAIESIGADISALSDCFLDKYRSAVPDEALIVSDCYKFREATNQVGRVDAPHTAVAKYRRDLEYNVLGPLKSHLNNCRQIKGIIDVRNRKMIELSAAEKRGDREVVRSVQLDFDKVDRHLFDWLMILEEYRGDILDSLLQTMKYLEYEFFAQSAHAIANVLPKRMEFRPMVEMVPKQLEIQLGLDRVAEQETGASASDTIAESGASGYVGSGKRGISDYSKLLIRKIESSSSSSTGEAERNPSSSSVVVDILSLSSLLAQGFEEGPARKALRECNNDTQSALDLLLGNRDTPVDPDADEEASPNGLGKGQVRIPTTLKRIQRMKELKKRMQEKKDKKLQEREEGAEAPINTASTGDLLDLSDETPQNFASEAYKKPSLPSVDDLLFG
jgi:hypothetical protein